MISEIIIGRRAGNSGSQSKTLLIGSYAGNNSADGPFVYTGFLPAWVLIKNSSASGENWNLFELSGRSLIATQSVCETIKILRKFM